MSIETIPELLQEKYGEGDYARLLSLPGNGIFGLRADTFHSIFRDTGGWPREEG